MRHLQSAPIWDIADEGARLGLRKIVSAAWPKLQAALVAAFGAAAVKAVAAATPVGGAAKAPGMATLEGYATLCGRARPYAGARHVIRKQQQHPTTWRASMIHLTLHEFESK